MWKIQQINIAYHLYIRTHINSNIYIDLYYCILLYCLCVCIIICYYLRVAWFIWKYIIYMKTLRLYVWNTCLTPCSLESTPRALKSEELGRSTKDWEVSWSVVVLQLFSTDIHSWRSPQTYIYIYTYDRIMMIQLQTYPACQMPMKPFISLRTFNF